MGGYLLTPRDTAVVLDIYKYRYLSVSQIKTLHFPSKQTAYRRLRVLRELGFLKDFTVPGVEEGIYHLDQRGAELVAGELQVEVSDLKWNRTQRSPKDYYFLRHFLKLNEFRIYLTLACRDNEGGICLLGFIPEYYGEKTVQKGVVKYIKDFVCDLHNQSERISHTPDAVFALEKEGKPALFFVEIDRGTETISDEEKGFLKCVRFYLNYLIEGKYRRYRSEFQCGEFKGFRTLIVTNSQARLDNMREVVGRFDFPQQAKRFLWATTDDRLSPQTLFDPIWHSLDHTDGNRYRI